MQRQAKEVHLFFYSQAFADGLRATVAILLPALAGMYLGEFETGITLSLGAMCVSLTDAPGPIVHKRNGMLVCAALAFLMAVITSFARLHVLTMGLEIALAGFFFSMFTVYGNRATSVGNVAILIMILTMDTVLPASGILPHALLIMGGGLFYLLLSIVIHSIRPYRIAQRALGECIREIATFLSIKADFYNKETVLSDNYSRLVAQQIVVNEKQDSVRELLFKTRQIVRESTAPGRKLLFAFIEAIDLFEDITAAYYDYSLLRKQFSDSGALDLISQTLGRMASELDNIGMAVQYNSSFTPSFDYDEELKQLKRSIDEASRSEPGKNLVLRKILVNIRRMLVGFNTLSHYFSPDAPRHKTAVDHSKFVTNQRLDTGLFLDNLSIRSSVFKHAIRVSLACLLGFFTAKLISYGHHSYWILLTIAFILKPAFSLTKQRNIERITGTLAGGAVGVLILLFIPNKTVQFFLMVGFMVGAYSFMRIKYLWMVVFMTPYVLILFSLLGSGFKDVAAERILDTAIGCTIAFVISYFLFPQWESEQIRNYMRDLLQANAAYLKKIIDALSGKKTGILEYKLARKDVYVHTANLSAAFQRMLSEPKSKQTSGKQVHQFVVLNHILFSNIATVTTTLLSGEASVYPAPLVHQARKAHQILKQSSRRFQEMEELPAEKITGDMPLLAEAPATLNSDNQLMMEQLVFITKVSQDIDKLVVTILDS